MGDITESCDRVFAQCTSLFFKSICGKESDGMWYMDGWIKVPKKEKIIFTYGLKKP